MLECFMRANSGKPWENKLKDVRRLSLDSWNCPGNFSEGQAVTNKRLGRDLAVRAWQAEV